MNYKLFSGLAFAVGAGIGAAVAWKLTKDYCYKIAQEEVDQCREYYKVVIEDIKTANKEMMDLMNGEEEPKVHKVEGERVSRVQQKPELIEYAKRIAEQNGYMVVDPEKEDDVRMNEDKPYPIDPDDFGEMGWDLVNYIYYADGTLADEYDNVLDEDEIEEHIGNDFADHFGEYQDDSVFIRNPEEQVDYEITKDTRNFSEVVQ